MTITVKETLREAAQSLGLGDEVEYYFSGKYTAVGKAAVELLLICFNRVENELALDYLPLVTEEEVVSGTGVVDYASLIRPAARILCVENEWGESVRYKLFPTYLKTQSGKLKIIYAYAPTAKTVEEASEYGSLVSQRLLVYGMAAEYCLAVGELTAASVWDKKYKEGIQAAYKASPCKRLRSRRWI